MQRFCVYADVHCSGEMVRQVLNACISWKKISPIKIRMLGISKLTEEIRIGVR